MALARLNEAASMSWQAELDLLNEAITSERMAERFLNLAIGEKLEINKVNFEIELKVRGTTKSQDKALITKGRNSLEVFGHDVSTVCFENCFCKM